MNLTPELIALPYPFGITLAIPPLWEHLESLLNAPPIIRVVRAPKAHFHGYKDGDAPLGHEYYAQSSLNTVGISPPSRINEYVAALHEIGHVRHKHIGQAPDKPIKTLQQEIEAWEWALSRAIVWDNEAHKVLCWSLDGYRKDAVSATTRANNSISTDVISKSLAIEVDSTNLIRSRQ